MINIQPYTIFEHNITYNNNNVEKQSDKETGRAEGLSQFERIA